jgi:hypothetical protein
VGVHLLRLVHHHLGTAMRMVEADYGGKSLVSPAGPRGCEGADGLADVVDHRTLIFDKPDTNVPRAFMNTGGKAPPGGKRYKDQRYVQQFVGGMASDLGIDMPSTACSPRIQRRKRCLRIQRNPCWRDYLMDSMQQSLHTE